MTTRNDVLDALRQLIENATRIETVKRRLVLWSKVDKLPAAFVRHIRDEYPARTAQALPAKVTMEVEIWVYTDAGKDPDAAPDIELNKLVDQIEKCFQPNIGAAPNLVALGIVQNKQTLNGLVDRAWIEGDIVYDPGDLDSKAKALIPVRVLVPTFTA